MMIYVLTNSASFVCLLGSIRTPDSVRTKIVRILQGYKKAHDHLTNTGAGLHGIAFSNYQDSVVNRHCPYYFALDPILGQRPNVKPWYTNEFETNDEQKDRTSECDDESVGSEELVYDIDEEVRISTRNTPVLVGSKRSQVINLSSSDDSMTVTMNTTSCSSSSCQRNIENSSMSGDSINQLESSSSELHNTTSKSQNTSSGSPKKKKSVSKATKKKPKLSPSAALEAQKSMIRKGVKQIHTKSTRTKMTDVLENEQKEREFIMETRKTKLILDKKKYDDMKQFEIKKINIDEKRLSMEEEERDLKREHIRSQTTLEKNKALLVKMEIFKMRQALKKSDPSLTDEFLDQQFPY
jgi:hypothetical protein